MKEGEGWDGREEKTYHSSNDIRRSEEIHRKSIPIIPRFEISIE